MWRRGVTSVQIAHATEAERAEARSLSADRRHKLRLDLGDLEGVSKLLENSLLGAEGACATPQPHCCPDSPAIPWMYFSGHFLTLIWTSGPVC